MTPITKYVVGYCIISNKTLHLLIIPTFRPTTDNLAQLEHILLSLREESQ